jgi:hypothetical protein
MGKILIETLTRKKNTILFIFISYFHCSIGMQNNHQQIQVTTYSSSFNDVFTDNADDRDSAPASPMWFPKSLKKSRK